MMRALHICTRYQRGGSERRVADVVDALPDVQHHVVVGRESDLGLAREQLAPATVSCEPTLVRPPAPAQDVLALRHIVRTLRRGSFDVLYTHQSKAGAIGRAAARLVGGPPTIHSLSMANFGPGYGGVEDRVFRVLERALSRCTNAYAVVGRDLAHRYESAGVPGDRLHVIRSGARLPSPGRDRASARAVVEARWGVPGNRPLILSLGSLDERKNVLALPDYLTEVASRTSVRPFLLVAGAGPLRDELQQLLDAQGLSRDARLIGHVTPADDLLNGADVLVLLSTAEGLPQVLVQAAAAGTPFVAFEVDGVAELVTLGAEGTMVPLGDVPAAAESTVPYLDRNDRERAGDRTRLTRALEDWSHAAIVRQHRALFEATTAADLPSREHAVSWA